MEQAGGGSVDWFAGLPAWVWLIGAGIVFGVGMLCLALALAAQSQDADLRVRGWDKRDHAPEDEWWKREYPEHEGA
jgi:hypothetical protein